MENITIGQVARKIARGLRQNATQAEKILWKVIKNRQFANFKFLRQHPIFTKTIIKKDFLSLIFTVMN